MNRIAELEVVHPSHDDDDDIFEQEYHELFENKLSGESVVVGQFYEKLSRFPNLADVSYIVVDTGYVHRLDAEKLKSIGYHCVITKNSKKFIELVKKGIRGVMFKEEKAVRSFKYIRQLAKLAYCANLSTSSVTSFDWVKTEDKTILIVNVDTESG